jgi:hypothetical protein
MRTSPNWGASIAAAAVAIVLILFVLLGLRPAALSTVQLVVRAIALDQIFLTLYALAFISVPFVFRMSGRVWAGWICAAAGVATAAFDTIENISVLDHLVAVAAGATLDPMTLLPLSSSKWACAAVATGAFAIAVPVRGATSAMAVYGFPLLFVPAALVAGFAGPGERLIGMAAAIALLPLGLVGLSLLCLSEGRCAP